MLYVVGLAPLPGQAVLELDLSVARAALDRLLGGSGLPAAREAELTEIELALLRTLGTFLVTRLVDAWSSVLPLKPTLQEPVLNPEFVQVTLPGETTIMVVHEITLVKAVGTLSLCLPHPLLVPAMDRLKAQVWFGGAQPIEEPQPVGPDIHGDLHQVQVSLAAELGRAALSLQELTNLAPARSSSSTPAPTATCRCGSASTSSSARGRVSSVATSAFGLLECSVRHGPGLAWPRAGGAGGDAMVGDGAFLSGPGAEAGAALLGDRAGRRLRQPDQRGGVRAARS